MRPRRFDRAAPRRLALALLAGLAACTHVEPSVPYRERYGQVPDVPGPEYWPARRTADLPALAKALPPILESKPGGDRLRIASAVPSGQGLVLGLRPVKQDGALLHPEAPPSLAYLTFGAGGAGDASPATAVHERLLRTPALGDAFTLREPLSAVAGLVVAVVEPSDAARACFDKLSEALLEAGYAVLRSDALPLVPRREEFALPDAHAAEPVARDVARQVDEQLAEKAFAVEGMLRYWGERKPLLERGRLVLLGIGDGAFAIPAIHLRLGLRADAAVLIGGEANLLGVAMQRAEAAGGSEVLGIDVRGPTGPLDAEARGWLFDLYLRESRLDPFLTSRWMRRTRTLLFHRRDDEFGRMVATRLEKPLRVTVMGDAEDVVDAGKDRTDMIVEWVAQ